MTDQFLPNSSATSAFFSRHKGNNKQGNKAVPGHVKKVIHGAQFPPLWQSPQVTNTTTSTSSSIDNIEPLEAAEVSKETHTVQHTSSEIISNKDEQENTQFKAQIINEKTRNKTSYSIEKKPIENNPRSEKFKEILSADVIEIDKLKDLSWNGIPLDCRPAVWQTLLNYTPSKQDRREPMLKRKRQEYFDCVQQYYYIRDEDRGMNEQKTLRQILVDIPRTHPDITLFHHPIIQHIMERVLYIWALRHPASGYVQGINDILTPFIFVFLTSYVDNPLTCDLSNISSEEYLRNVEADSYWCLTKLLDDIQDHYTTDQPGLQRMVSKMEDLVHRCDVDLYKHIVETESIQFVQFSFRWMNCLLMREIPFLNIIRLWDTYLCETGGFEKFHVYVCTSILMTFGEQLKQMSFQDMVLFLQNLPTKNWTIDNEIEPLLSRAFILQSYFEDAPNHLSQN